ncbi:MAG: helix-turn-helix transcriptional regulator [Chitinophagaceae bacterium]
MNRVDRLFAILTLIQSKKFVPAERIADHFQISVRTVYRDIRALDESGIPVSFEPGKGYFIVQGYFLPPVSFSAAEANALMLMETMVRGFTDLSIQKHYSNALSKIKSVLPASQIDRMETLNHQTKMQIPGCMESKGEYLSLLQHAISFPSILEMEYKNNKEEITHRQVEPIGLIFYAFNWHLIAWCRLKEDYRDFRISRILRLKETGKGFQKTSHLNLEEYMKLLPVNY